MRMSASFPASAKRHLSLSGKTFTPVPTISQGWRPKPSDERPHEGGNGRKEARAAGPQCQHVLRTPLKIVRGEGVWLIDDSGRAYLDCYQQCRHISAMPSERGARRCRSRRRSSTPTRAICTTTSSPMPSGWPATLPKELDTFFVVCTGSRGQRPGAAHGAHHTGRDDVIVLDWAYHGHTQELIDISPYKYRRKGGKGAAVFTHVAADSRQSIARLPLAGRRRTSASAYADEAAQNHFRLMRAKGDAPAAFIAETIPSVAGQIFLPPGYLKEVYAPCSRVLGASASPTRCRSASAVSEAPCGLSRSKGSFPTSSPWASRSATAIRWRSSSVRREIADSFANGMEYFNTFGGNPGLLRRGPCGS